MNHKKTRLEIAGFVHDTGSYLLLDQTKQSFTFFTLKFFSIDGAIIV